MVSKMTNMAKRGERRYNIADAKAEFSRLVREVLAGEDVVIAKDGKPLVRVVPIHRGSRTPGSAKGLITIAADFDAPLADFDQYQ
jgi:prevent-host-death family protein